MKNIDKIKNMSEEELIDFLDHYGCHDEAPWCMWFENEYCKKCESVWVDIDPKYGLGDKSECSYCEVNGNKCRFTGTDDWADIRNTIKWWLNQEKWE